MSVMWKYLDKRSAAIAAIKDYDSMQFIISSTGEEVRNAYDYMSGVGGMRLDGMPRAQSTAARGLDVRLEKREAMERILNRESALLRRYEQEARAEMDRMRPEHYAFCALYFLAGLSLTETAEAIDRSERQCMRYKREIEQGEE